MQGELTLEQKVGWNTVVSLSYLTSQGRDLPNFIDTNIDNATVGQLNYTDRYPGAGAGKKKSSASRRRYTHATLYICATELFYTEILRSCSSNVNSNYNAGVLAITHRTVNGISFGMNYTVCACAGLQSE